MKKSPLKSKRVIIDNTYHSILLYFLSFDNWNDAEFIIIKGRVSESFIQRLSEFSNTYIFDYWPVIWLKKPINSLLNRIRMLGIIKGCTEVIGNIYELKLDLDFYKKNGVCLTQVDDGQMSLNQLKGIYNHRLNYNGFRNFFLFRYFLKINYGERKNYNSWLLPDFYRNHSHSFLIEDGTEIKYTDIRDKLENLDDNKRSQLQYLFGFNPTSFPSHIESLLFLQPLYEEGLVASLAEEIRLYKKIIKEQFGTETNAVYLKPHPRSKINYFQFFPNCSILSRDFPYELFLSTGMTFGKIVTISSSSIDEFKEISNEIFCYGNDFIKQG